MWKNTVGRGRPQMIIWRMRIACWRPKATNAHTVCVILIAFPLQQWLRESPSLLRYAYIACLILLLGNCYNAYTLKLTYGTRFILLYSQSLVGHARFEVLTALLLKVEVSWGVSQCAGKLFSMFRRIVVPSYSGSSRQRRMTFLRLIPPEYKDNTILRDVVTNLPVYTA
jgi:hypothetical protein